jgi:hypothetical protein
LTVFNGVEGVVFGFVDVNVVVLVVGSEHTEVNVVNVSL